MTTLVFGGTGFIGRRTVPRLVDAGERVVVMDINPATADYSALGESVRVLGGDVTNFEDVVKAVMNAQPDRIINLAYMIGGGENTPHFSFRLDLLGMDNCFEAARLCGVNRVVYASSFAVSGLQRHFGDRALNEDDPAYGNNIYAMNKRYNEFQAAQFNRAYGMNIIGIRPPMVTGYDKERGSMAHVRMVTLPAQGLPVSFPQSGMMQIPLHVDDIAETFTRITLAEAPRHTVYNTGGTAISLADLADLVREFIPNADIFFDSDGGLEDSPNYLIDNSRLMSEFELAYAPYRDRVLQMINEVREHHSMHLVEAK